MKKYLLLAIVFVAFTSCNDGKKTEEQITQEEIAYASIGEKINDAEAMDSSQMLVMYEGLKKGDTINTKMRGDISEVCAMKGCWMTLKMDDDNEVRVTFKDYGFFMPLDASGEVVINGKAFVTETSVDDLKHYAEDAGKSAEEIAVITAPKLTYAFEADGVLLKQ